MRTKKRRSRHRRTRAIAKGEAVFIGEERAQRIVTRRWVDEHWDARDRETFAEYAIRCRTRSTSCGPTIR